MIETIFILKCLSFSCHPPFCIHFLYFNIAQIAYNVICCHYAHTVCYPHCLNWKKILLRHSIYIFLIESLVIVLNFLLFLIQYTYNRTNLSVMYYLCSTFMFNKVNSNSWVLKEENCSLEEWYYHIAGMILNQRI